MAIRIKHDAAAGMIGAYAAGQAASRKRRQKYGMDLLGQNQRHRQRMEELALRGGLGGRGGVGGRAGGKAGGGAIAGQWEDPLAEANPFFAGLSEEAQIQQRVQQRAQQRAAGRKYRLGEEYQGDLLPKFVSEGELEARQAARDQDAELRREDAEWTRDQGVKERAARARNLPEIPEALARVEPDLYADLVKKRRGITNMLTGGTVDWDDPAKGGQAAFDKAMADYEAALETVDKDKLTPKQLVIGDDGKPRPAEEGEMPEWIQEPGGQLEPTKWGEAKQQQAEAAKAAESAATTQQAAAEQARKDKLFDLKLKLAEIQAQRYSEEATESAELKAARNERERLLTERIDSLEAGGSPDAAAAPEADGEGPVEIDLAADEPPEPPAGARGAAEEREAAATPTVGGALSSLGGAAVGAAKAVGSGVAGAGRAAAGAIDTSPFRTNPPTKPAPTGRAADIAQELGMVWRKLPNGQHGWIPKERAMERVGQRFDISGPETSAAGAGALPVVRNPGDLAALPSGAEFIGPDGKKRRKK